jgi:DnaK suppressor protein
MVIDLKLIRARLDNEKKRLEEVMEQTKAGAPASEERREGSPFGKREEEATQSFELEKRLALEKKIKDNIAEIDHALEKFAKGTYGRCDICGKPIDPARLEALPSANLCLSCKVKHTKYKSGVNP